jgi:hypothetical protein
VRDEAISARRALGGPKIASLPIRRNKMIQGYDTVKTLPRRKPGPTLRALSRRINGSRLSPGKRCGGGFIKGGSAARPVANSQ